MNRTNMPDVPLCWIQFDEAGDGLVKVSLFTAPAGSWTPVFQKSWHQSRREAENYHGAVALESLLCPRYGMEGLDRKKFAEWRSKHEPRDYFQDASAISMGVPVGPYSLTEAVV